jgi:L-ascorbate metabolism protein UlaG (beta-lactamase superfamily)
MAPVLTWLGQAGFLLEAAGRRVLIDPFFSEHEGRAYAPPSIDAYGTGIDWLFITHEHLDHLDRPALPAIVERSPNVRVVVPAPIVDQVLDVAPDVVAVQRAERIELPGLGAFAAVPAVHALEPADGYSDDPRFVGYVLELDGVAIYHAGDTIVTQGLLDALGGVRVDVALLPINGRDFFRERENLAGNTDAREAVALARHVGARVLVPLHWDAFTANSARPAAAVDAAVAAGAPLHVLVPCRGVPWVAV